MSDLIGFIGVGTMGEPMCRNLAAKSGQPVRAYDSAWQCGYQLVDCLNRWRVENERDFDTRFAKARLLMAAGQMETAMDELLEIILRDKTWNEGAARKTYVAILELILHELHY